MAVTVTYEYPVAGLVPPVAITQAKDFVTANVIADADGDLAATITHNLGISVADLAAGLPVVTLEPLQTAGTTEARLADWIVTSKTANTVVLGKTNAGGSGAAAPTLRVHVQRPHSIGR